MNAPELAAHLGLHRAGREWRGSCPACGYESDACTLSTGREGKPLLWCAACQNKDALAAILRGAGIDSRRAAGEVAIHAKKLLEARHKAVEQARICWTGASAITPSDPAGKYLARRGLDHLIPSMALRYREDVAHPAERGRRPAMLALVQDASGQLIGTHRTYVTQDGHKAHVVPQKASKGPIWGGAIRLAPTAPEIVIGEGVETSASAGLLLSLPAWAAINSGNLGKGLILPPEVRSVVIAGDDDGVNAQGRNPGLNAAEAAAARWQAEGRKVRIIKPTVAGKDFNNILMAREAGKAMA